MSEKIQTQKISETQARFKYSADGTNYDIVAMLFKNGFECGFSCITDEPAMLVIAGFEKTAYTFRLNGYISWDYVYEKLCRNGSQIDAKNLTVLVHQAQMAFQGVM